jgi:protocatechuate 3,4-dioxygenase beta subunit
VNAKGFATPDEQRVKAPQSDAEALVVRLSRFARVRGVVVDSAGKPVAGATLEVQSESSGQRVVFQRGEQDATDDEGRFELDDVTPGASKLTAKHAQFASSAPYEVRLTPGEELADVRLVLPVGGRIAGRIHQSQLQAGLVWAVNLSASGGGSQNMETQPDGSFVAERLTPGKYSLTAHTRTKFVPNVSPEDQVRDMRHLRGSVEVRAGETSDVTLGAPSGAAIPLSGRVTLGGRPVAGANVVSSRRDFSGNSVSDANGAYKLDLDGPGSYLVHASLHSGVSMSVRIEASGEAALTQNFEFEGTLLAGVVQFEDGKPVANAYVSAELERAAVEGQVGASRAATQVKADGRFAFEGLAPGVYVLSVRDVGRINNAAARFGDTRVSDIELPVSARRDDLVIRVAPDAVLECRVSSSSGAPAPGARLKLFDPSGGNYGSWSQETTDGVGIARVGGLAAGELRVLARSAGEAGLSAVTTVRAGATVQAAVQLRLSGSIAITRVDEQGKPAGGSMAIIDESGFDWGRGASEWKVEGDVWTASPLPAGRYRVSGSNKTSTSADSVVTVAAGETASVTLEFKAR